MLYSVIVPIYNREKSISKCIDSILNQTESDFELILVDDGSVDNTGKICDEYKKLDERVIVIHKDNGGVSSARNAGIDIAQGKYIVFVDSDDYVADTYLETFNNIDADLVVSGLLFGNSKKKFEIDECKKNLDEDEIISFLNNTYALPSVGKRFNTDIIHNNKVRFYTTIYYGEDAVFCSEYIKHCNSLSYRKAFTYYYCDIYTNSLSKTSGEDIIKQYSFVQESIYNVFKYKPKVQNFLISKYIWYVEKTINEISQMEISHSEKKKRVDILLSSKYFKLCLKNYKQAGYSTSLLNIICYKLGLANVILYRMKKHNEKREK